MTDQADLLAQFSNALATRAEAAENAVAAERQAPASRALTRNPDHESSGRPPSFPL